MYRFIVKRILDFFIATVVFILFAPIFVMLCALLYIVNDGKPFFFQKRPGLRGEIFKIVKFKTMNDRCDQNGNLLPDSVRLTPIGKFIRKTSLDEVPQLINVVKGEMSLVGPRPLLPQYMELYDENQRHRHDVRPGITGWAQINGRNAISWREKFNLDIYYVDHCSFILDLRILYLTFIKVFKSEGINASKHVTMEAFNGKN